MLAMLGASLTGRTVTVNDRVTRLLWLCPSLTVTEIVAVPVALAAGLKLNDPVLAGLE